MIGVLGATGDVGRHAVGFLERLGIGPVRAAGSAVADFRDPASLDRFASGCEVLVNCAGPAHAIGDRVAEAARRAGAHYVDASGDEPVDVHSGRTALLSAGLQPGLTAVLPRWLARDAEVHGLKVWLGVSDLFSRSAAEDYLHAAAAGHGEALAAWRGERRSRALTRETGVTLPFFPEPVTLLPYFTPEAERLARALRVAEGDWYTVLAGDHVGRAFDRVHGIGREEAVADLCRASRLDLADRAPRVVLIAEADGRTAVLRAKGNGVVTGAVVALAVSAVERDELPPGSYFAGDVLRPQSLVDGLAGLGAVDVGVFDHPLSRLVLEEEGAL
ncbi:hypothetical protein SD37_07345 [Amycolatopsis orientalis]|uniref:Saccharopine dehydrogenase NADP binding domain-containing protein n=1 Tax=Amycolatopsis orientalis TaxID=31958 RepID=A0A193BTH6_AMYOR|nr:hypothetical protein [Amycolatopsis orientalis]ANN15488.1 hypothetical protein SD37_07345 [Amycolatopsis orientalis]